MKISTAAEGDLQELSAAFDSYSQFYRQPANPAGARSFIGERLQRRDASILLAQNSAGELLGFTQLYPSFSSVGMKPIWILNDLFVLPQWRRQGIGRALMEAARELAIASGASALTLATETTNTAAQALYQSLGYVRDSQFLYFRLALEDQP